MSQTPTARQWIKSSYSESSSGGRGEYSPSSASIGIVPVRDSKDPHGPALAVPIGTWRSFLAAVRSGGLAD
ncbi:DUF397 domain-containing protein [Streptomyces avicenniae]|uniref:DUF397 domain-containing protein n=1 Tax=Streptomyces avicenniae TaxID=500153 RepID=UPI000DA5F8BD|nr:DUF397 domain-containing protein [Streptomyces avicenniae]